MCGIAGMFKSHVPISGRDRTVLADMLNAIKHRGPDDEGVYEHKNCLMGYRRLAIIDLEKGNQPIFNEDRSVAVTYNGEIYNYRELRDVLVAKGHRFCTESDTEVIVHAYEEWGEACFGKFSGMFAAAIFDSRKKTLLLARDRAGMKPVYFWRKNDILLWASEIKSLLLYGAPFDDVRPDHRTICDFITFQNTIDEKTFFKNIVKLLPGHFMKVTERTCEIKKYWDLEFHDRKVFGSLDEALNVYESTFKAAVKRHLASDVEIASYLSGGFDSSSVAYFASQFLNYPLKTFTGYFSGGRKYDERNITRLFGNLTDTRNIEVRITPKDFRENIEKVIYHLDEPTLGSGALPQYIVAGEVSRHVKVVLTGHGGDELFAGYQVYKASFYKDLFKKDFLSFLNSFWRNRPDEILKILYFSLYPLISREVRHGLFIMFDERQRPRIFTPEFLGSLGDYDPVKNLEDKYLKGRNFSHTERTLYLYLKTYLPTLFIQEDKMGMAHSIESRMPICDNEMLELSAQIPDHYKLYNNTLKYLPKTMMKKYLTKEFYKQPKMGFPTPISIWFRRDLKDFVYDILTDNRVRERNIFNVKYIKNLLDFHLRFGGDTLYDYARANKIYSLLSVELWFRAFIDRPRASAGEREGIR